MFAVTGVLLYGSMTTFARLAYAHGSGPFDLIAIRTFLIVLVVGMLAIACRGAISLPRKAWRNCATFGTAIVGASICHLSAVMFIPVGLAAQIVYLYPLMVALVDPMRNGRKVAASDVLCLSLAFLGLTVALGPSLVDLDWRGISLALLAACFATATLIISRPLFADQAILPVVFWSNIVGGLLVLPVIVVLGGLKLPPLNEAAYVGWAGIGCFSIMFFAAIVAQSAAVRNVGPTSTATIFNLEPIIAIVASTAMLGELLTLPQCLGAISVVMAVTLSGVLRSRSVSMA